MAGYGRLIGRVEDLEDAVTLDRAEQTSRKLVLIPLFASD